MNETLKILYDKFYTPPKMIVLRQEIETSHQQLVGQLEKTECERCCRSSTTRIKSQGICLSTVLSVAPTCHGS
nr:hypothetical protein [uncultured Oscillibacter sp.]